MIRTSRMILSALALAPLLGAPPSGAVEPVEPELRSTIDLVLCLDTSNSMDGLIDSAKLKLWDIVSELAEAKPTPRLRVALLSFGNDSYKGEGWVRKDLGFTDDLDTVYEKLNALTTNGGTEYVARVLRESIHTLDWSRDELALKIIFVAGNEPATQDPKYPVDQIAREAVERGIVVSTIYCGSPTDRDAASWRMVAQKADGEFAAIDQDRGTLVVSTPMDARLNELSSELSTTYVGYGQRAVAAKARQEAQDANAAGASASTGAARAVAKSSKLYTNAAWDLVDASEEAGFELDKVPADQLPAEMQAMSPEEREAHLAKMKERRKQVQAEIQDLSKQRAEYIEAEKAKTGKSEDRALDKAIKDTLRKKAAEKNITIE
jgi:hypothetical protein